MRKLSRSRVIASVVFGLLLVLGGLAVDRILLIASLQDALNRDWEINYNDGERPTLLTEGMDRTLRTLLSNLFPEPEYRFFAQKKNRAEAWRDRIYGLSRGRITRLELFYPEVLRADLGHALSRFRSLKELVVNQPEFSTKDWIYVFRGLMKLPSFERLEINEEETRQVDETALEALVGHPGIRSITLHGSRIGTQVIETFATMPNLKEITFGNEVIDDGHKPWEPVLPEIQKMFRDGLPGVKIVFEPPTEKPPPPE